MSRPVAHYIIQLATYIRTKPGGWPEQHLVHASGIANVVASCFGVTLAKVFNWVANDIDRIAWDVFTESCLGIIL